MKMKETPLMRRTARRAVHGIKFQRANRPMEQVHCIGVNPRGEAGPAQAAACWFRTTEEADSVFLKMSQCPQLERHTLERFALHVPPGASKASINLLALSATDWGAYRAVVCRLARATSPRPAAGAPLPPRVLMLAHSVLATRRMPEVDADVGAQVMFAG